MTGDISARVAGLLALPMAQAQAAVRRRFLAIHGPGPFQVVLWGAGPLARVVISGLRRAGVVPLAICDRDPQRWGASFEGLAIQSPQEALASFGTRAVFVPTIYTNHSLLEHLDGLGVRTMPLAVLAWQLPETLLPHCALDLPTSLHRDAGRVIQAAGLWADEASQAEYLGQIQWRSTLDDSLLPPKSDFAGMFHPADIVDFLPMEHFVDCGAFDGDTIRNYLRHHPLGHGRITAIEPDPHTFRRLVAYRDSLDSSCRARIRLVQAALGRDRGVVAFQATGSVASSAALGGETRVPVETLDSLEEAEGATFIKMDIEGAEADALAGAHRLIQRNLPILAICLYHRSEDVWNIPMLIRTLAPDYRMFLRRYSDECWETVCYAVPPDRTKNAGSTRSQNGGLREGQSC